MPTFAKIKNLSFKRKVLLSSVTAIPVLLIGFTNCSKGTFSSKSTEGTTILSSTSGTGSAGSGSTGSGSAGSGSAGSGGVVVSPPVVVAPAGSAAPRAGQSAIVLGVPDEFISIYTNIPISEEVFVCAQSNDDMARRCQNGAIAGQFSKASFNSGGNSVWMSQSLYNSPDLDFGDYTVFVMKKDASGQLSQLIGTVAVSIRLPELAPNEYWTNAGAWSSGGGSNKIYATCRVPNVAGFSVPAGYKRYPYNNKECYYKIQR